MAKGSAKKRLARLKREVKAEARSAPAPRAHRRYRITHPPTLASVGLAALRVVSFVALPFLGYVRSSVFLYSAGWAPWLAVAGGVTLTLAIVALYATWLAKHVMPGKRGRAMARMFAVPMVAGWLLYSMLFLARVNAKTDDVRSYYRSLHPVLRVAVSTVMIVDPSAVITDLQRIASDYGRMGLPVNNTTRHYVQADGWVHAVDVRTNGRGELRNRALQLYFWACGFSTTRHVGTADHLHVQLH